MDSTSASAYLNLLNQLGNYSNIIPKDLITSFRRYTQIIYKSDLQEDYSQPVPWIGMYIALASLVCILAMMADLLHGLRNRRQCFPCKYFTLNAASLSMIAVAIKLPVDLTNLMPTRVDQVTKIGSMAFMCTMMVNLLPSLASMDSQQLVANLVALGVLVITLVVNICIQIYTGVIFYPKSHDFVSFDKSVPLYADQNKVIASIYVAMLLFLLMVYTCSALAISEAKRILESRYRLAHEEALMDLQQAKRLSLEKLKSHVTKYWIMAETVTPEFTTLCNATSSASGVICVLNAIFFTVIVFYKHLDIDDHDSDYKWSIPVILVTQYIGVILGTIAPVSRCFAPLYLKVSVKWIIRYYLYVFTVDKYWTHKLSVWGGFTFIFGIPKGMDVISMLRYLIFSVCVWLQKTIVVACKMVALIPNLFIICLLFCYIRWLKESTQHWSEFLRMYVLEFQEDKGNPERSLKHILKSLNRVIQKAEKQQPENLEKLLAKSPSFIEIERLFSYRAQSLTVEQRPECWSLSLVTLTAITTSLPDIPNHKVKSLCMSVHEGLAYVTHVEERLNAAKEYVGIQNAAKQLWVEVRVQQKWLGYKVKDHVPPLVMNTTREILEWFKNTSNNIVTNEEPMADEETNSSLFYKRVCADSMYRFTKSILLSYQEHTDRGTQETVFDLLSLLISQILAAFLTNLPQVIALKCHTNMTQERKASVHAAAQLLGETSQIINKVQYHRLPGLYEDELAFIESWSKYYFEDPHFP